MGKNRGNFIQHNSPMQQQGVVVQREQSFSGPLPPPEILGRYNDILPGAAERIIQMAEKQAAHRQALETVAISSDASRSKWGQIFGFIVATIGLVVSCLLGIYGSAITASVMGAGTLVALVSVFIYGSKTRKNERLEKSN